MLEADWVVRSNIKFHLIEEEIRQEIGYGDPTRIFDEWLKWLKDEVKKRFRST